MTTETGTDETRQRIIDAAIGLFGEVGYSGATTRAIAERAGINEVTLFRHFGNKKNLLLACIQAGNQAGFAATFRDHLTGDYAADIGFMARLQMADTAAHFDILRLLMCDAQAVPELRDMMASGASGNRDLLAGYFREQIDAGVIRADLDPEALATAFDSLFSSYIVFANLMGSGSALVTPSDATLDSLAGIFVRGTVASPRG
ncbi:MAG: TetR/AcrR family transcriptional regulator [Anaerolineae bacterium]|nr:TetR/AcrR family transcriptional regulator [Anaerolineae bacterium]